VTRRARILHGPTLPRPKPLLPVGSADTTRKRIARAEVEAHLEAERIVAAARAQAEAIVATAKAEAADKLEEQRRIAAEEADTKLCARWLLLRREERRQLEGSIDRVITLATALAERLLDASLELAPDRIVALARKVLSESGGARRAVVEAHPRDAEALQPQLLEGAFDLESIEVRVSETLARGELRLHTDIGIVDARLAPRFHRLAAALRDVLE
jgi:flagellar biosynthesis/type III secretory pathway protein FliH